MRQVAILPHGPTNIIGGAERFFQYLLNFLKEEGFGVDVYEPALANIPDFLYPLARYYTGSKLGRKIKNYDLIFSIGYAGGFLKGRNVINICIGTAKSYFGSIRKLYNYKFLFRMYMSIILDRLSKRGKVCLAISPQVEKELIKDYGVHSTVVFCGVDIEHFRRRTLASQIRLGYGIGPESFVCAFVGRWDMPHKGLDLLVPIMRERQDVHWLIVPDHEVNIEGIKNLTVLSDINYEELPDVYSCADISVQLSRYESFGFSFVESLSCSVPVISTPVGIATYLYDDPLLSALIIDGNGYQAEKIITDVHKKIDKLKDRHYLELLMPRCREKVEQEFSLKAWKERMRIALRSVLEGNNASERSS